jgi:two-component system, LytTR family, response regulator
MENKALIRCIVLDDEFLAVKLLSGYIEQTGGLKLALATTKASEAIGLIKNGLADLIFLDVQMPEITGIELMNITRNFDTRVILTTAYTQYALEGYEHDIIDYLLKPITFDRFLIATNKAKARLQTIPSISPINTPDYIFVKTEYRLQKVVLANILYLEGLRDYIAFHTTTGKILSLERMKNMDDLLPQNSFLRIHKSYIINISNIDYIERGRIVINKEHLPIGETYKELVRSKLGIGS